MSNYDFFWNVMNRCDWDKEGDDEQVLAPVVTYLAASDDNAIFTFDDMMSKLLYALDTKELADQYEEAEGFLSPDDFLYSRCVALINGPGYYDKILKGQDNEIWDMEFEAILYVPSKAWALKHQADESDYPHIPPVSYETGSNDEAW